MSQRKQRACVLPEAKLRAHFNKEALDVRYRHF